MRVKVRILSSGRIDPQAIMEEWLQVADDPITQQKLLENWREQDVLPSPAEFLRVLAPLAAPRIYLPREVRHLATLFEQLDYHHVRWYLALKTIAFFQDDDFVLRILHADGEIHRYTEHFFRSHPVIKVRECQDLLKGCLKRIDRILELDSLERSSHGSVTTFSRRKLASLADLIVDSLTSTEFFSNRFLLYMFLAVFVTWYRHLKEDNEGYYFSEKARVHVEFCQALARSMLVHVTEHVKLEIGIKHHVIAPLKVMALPYLNLTDDELEATLEELMTSRNPWACTTALFKLIALHRIDYHDSEDEITEHLEAIREYLECYDEIHGLDKLDDRKEEELIDYLKRCVFSSTDKLSSEHHAILKNILRLIWKRQGNVPEKMTLLDMLDDRVTLEIIKDLIKQFPDPREHHELWRHFVRMVGRSDNEDAMTLQLSLLQRTPPLPLPLIDDMVSSFLQERARQGEIDLDPAEKVTCKRYISALTSLIVDHSRKLLKSHGGKNDSDTLERSNLSRLSENLVDLLMLFSEDGGNDDEVDFCLEVADTLMNTGVPPCQARGIAIIRLWGSHDDIQSVFQECKGLTDKEVVEELLVLIENELIEEEDAIADFMTRVVSLPDLHLALEGFRVFAESENCWIYTDGVATLLWNVYLNQAKDDYADDEMLSRVLQATIMVFDDESLIETLDDLIDLTKGNAEARNAILKKFSEVITASRLKSLLKAAGMRGYSTKRKHELVDLFFHSVLNVEDYVPFQMLSREEQYRLFVSCWWSFWRAHEGVKYTKTTFFKEMRQHFRKHDFTFHEEGFDQYLAPFVSVIIGSSSGYFNDPEYHVVIPIPPALRGENVSLDAVIPFLEKFYQFNPSMVDLFLSR